MEDALVQERIKRMRIDYPAAAERLLVALSHIAQKFPARPVSAVNLCAHCFPREVREHWSRETRRRRVRDAVEYARQKLFDRKGTGEVTLVADGRGYFVTGDVTTITWYASQRRRRGLHELAAGSQVKHTAANPGQGKMLFMEAEGDNATIHAAIDSAARIIGGDQ